MKKLIFLTPLLLYMQSTWTMQDEVINNAQLRIHRMLVGDAAENNNPLLLPENQHLNTGPNNAIIEEIALKNWQRLFTLKQRLNAAIPDEQLNGIQVTLQNRLLTPEFSQYQLEARAQEFLRSEFRYHEEGLCGMYYGKWAYDPEQERVLNAAITDEFLEQHNFTPQEIVDIRRIIHNRITIRSLDEIQEAIQRVQGTNSTNIRDNSSNTGNSSKKPEQPEIIERSYWRILMIIIIAPIIACIIYFLHKKAPAKKVP